MSYQQLSPVIIHPLDTRPKIRLDMNLGHFFNPIEIL